MPVPFGHSIIRLLFKGAMAPVPESVGVLCTAAIADSCTVLKAHTLPDDVVLPDVVVLLRVLVLQVGMEIFPCAVTFVP